MVTSTRGQSRHSTDGRRRRRPATALRAAPDPQTRRRVGATVVAAILILSALPAGAGAVAASEDSAGASQNEGVDATDATSQVVAIIATRERPPSETCDEPDVVSLELYDPETGVSDVVISNETDCTAGVSRVRTSPDRSMITYQEPGPSTSILELGTGSVVRSIHDCGNAEWNPDGSLLACRELTGSVKIIVVETGSNVNSLRLPGESPADAFDWVGPTELLATSAGAGSPCVVPSHLGPRRSALWRIEIAEPTFTHVCSLLEPGETGKRVGNSPVIPRSRGANIFP